MLHREKRAVSGLTLPKTIDGRTRYRSVVQLPALRRGMSGVIR